MPPIPHWKENNVRKGFLTIERDSRLADACASVGLWLRTMLEMGYTFGWRVSELKNLEGRQNRYRKQPNIARPRHDQKRRRPGGEI
jgi:site-specific recombinase XerD